MSVRNLDRMFRPQSVAVFGATDRPRSVGATVMRNLLGGGFRGPIMPVNPKHRAVAGIIAYPNVRSLPETPDLAVIATPPATVPGLIRELGERGTRAAVVLTAGLELQKGPDGDDLQHAALRAAKPYLLRILGPNCVGLMIPGLGLNASFAHTSVTPGRIAFVTQSGALSTAVVDYAKSNDIGFSYFVSLGNNADVDFGDVLDYLASDPCTAAILLYIESVKEARKFMSAARAAARNKPVLAVKSGRVPEGAKAATSHTGALAGADDVFEEALRRAGILRIDTIDGLFDAVETLARARPVDGSRLAILTNGGGPGVIATDALVRGGGRLANLSEATLAELDSFLPGNWSRGNPVDIIGDAPVDRYVRALKILQEAPECDAIVFLHAPTAIVPSDEIARGLAPLTKLTPRNVLACWLGRDGVAQARRICSEAGIPTYDTPEDAVDAFLQIARYHANQSLLKEMPHSPPVDFAPQTEVARRVVREVLAADREQLTEPEAKSVLAAYGIPVVETRVAATAIEAESVAVELGFPVAVKLLSPDVIHKSDIGGVALDLETGREVRAAAESMGKRLHELQPSATLLGFSVQKMARRPGAQELIVGAATDPVFGPVILFGQGGTAVEVIRDRAVALPPLNGPLAHELIGRTRVSRLLRGYRGRPPANLDAICLVLVQVSQMIADLPEIVELDINPLFADESGVLALDARIRVVSAAKPGVERLAIRPYPRELEELLAIAGRPLRVRPIRPEDERLYRTFLESVTPRDAEFRGLELVRDSSPTDLARHTQIDYDREMCLVAIGEGTPERIVGAVQSLTDPDNLRAQCAMAVLPEFCGKGLGRALLAKMIDYCRKRGTCQLTGRIYRDDKPTLAVVRELQFEITPWSESSVTEVRLPLQRTS